MRFALRRVVAGLAVLQIGETLTTAHFRISEAARLDHLGFPEMLRPVVPLIKLSASLGLVAGLKNPRIGAVASAALVSFYAAAVGFHSQAGDRTVVALPATALGVTAALCLVHYFLPAIEAPA
jgi:hypothetical protein